uniref:AarF domain containing kinase 1 n=1 Tax=Ailuropoda melanoleuca TaxID=9646 RepID=A0A7N5JQ66_AILME
MARRALKLASWTGAALAASGLYLYGNKYLDPNDFGAVRVGRAVATTAVISYDYLTSLRSVPYGSEEYLQLRSKVHLRSARRLCELCCANRGTFIKVGQHLGALDYLLPEEYTSTLKVLHSQAPRSSMQEVQQVIREDLGKECYAGCFMRARNPDSERLGNGRVGSLTRFAASWYGSLSQYCFASRILLSLPWLVPSAPSVGQPLPSPALGACPLGFLSTAP